METVAPAAAGHQAAGELVDDDDLAVVHHVVHVAAEQRVPAQRLVDVVEQRHVGRVVEAARLQAVAEHRLGVGHAAFGQRHRLVLLVDDVVAGELEGFAIFRFDVALGDGAELQLRDDAIDLVVEVGRLLGRAGDDQRRAGFVDQDRVDFVDNREVVAALDVLRQLELHVVAKVVEPELVVGAVGDVAAVGDLALGVVQVVLDDADRHAEEAVDAAHPLRVAPRQVVVHRDDVDAFAGEGVEIRGQRGDERLAFARLHFGDLALVQDHAADELHVEVPHVEHAAPGFADDREGFGQDGVERFAATDPLAELGGLGAELIVGQGPQSRPRGR